MDVTARHESYLFNNNFYLGSIPPGTEVLEGCSAQEKGQELDTKQWMGTMCLREGLRQDRLKAHYVPKFTDPRNPAFKTPVRLLGVGCLQFRGSLSYAVLPCQVYHHRQCSRFIFPETFLTTLVNRWNDTKASPLLKPEPFTMVFSKSYESSQCSRQTLDS